MKKILLFMAVLCGIAAGLPACSDDSNAEANCTYQVLTDSIAYTDSLDIPYDSLIRESLAALQYSGRFFTESAKVDQSLISFAIAKCDEQALNRFMEDLNQTIPLSDVRNEMYRSNSDYFAAQGITNAAAIPLHPFTVTLILLNFTQNTYIYTGTISAQ